MNRTQRDCPFCRHGGTLLYDNVMAAVGPFDLSYEIRACGHCDGVYSDKLAPRADYDRYYATMSKHDWAPVPDDSDSGRCHRRLARLIGEAAPPDSRVLDIGCGTGHLLFCLKESGFSNLSGLDPSPQSPRIAREHFGLNGIYTGFIDTVARTSHLDGCDVCCLTGVLEHLYDPLEQLRPVVDRLRPGALVAVGVPDLDAFTAENREPFGELSLEHINFFSQRSLAAFFARLGCRLETCVSQPGRDESNLLAVAVKAPEGLYSAGTAVTSERPGRVQAESIPHFDARPAEPGRVDDVRVMEDYLKASEAALAPRLAEVARKMTRKTVVYGAGSHTARLLPRLKNLGVFHHCAALADRNPNLHGQTFGGLPVLSPDRLADMPDCDILVSSYRFENEIAAALRGRPNRVLTIYE